MWIVWKKFLDLQHTHEHEDMPQFGGPQQFELHARESGAAAEGTLKVWSGTESHGEWKDAKILKLDTAGATRSQEISHQGSSKSRNCGKPHAGQNPPFALLPLVEAETAWCKGCLQNSLVKACGEFIRL